MDLVALASSIKQWARELGCADCRIADVRTDAAMVRYRAWLARGWHGEMDYLARHADLRAQPDLLLPGALRAVCVRMDYLRADAATSDWRAASWQSIDTPTRATVSRYALGRDYHKVLRGRLAALAQRIDAAVGPTHRARVFTDSAPVLEVELATKAGLGWRGKHTLLLDREGGSMFFLGGLYTNLALPVDAPTGEHCGQCTACIDVCPTRAIVGPHQLDARRCISYLTIEAAGPIPVALRTAIGNRIYGCDDCQLVCPWNKFAQRSPIADFDPRHGLDAASLLDLWAWNEATFLARTEGSAIRRIGYERWRRNLAVGLGNALRAPDLAADDALAIRHALSTAREAATALVREHIDWALDAELASRAPA